MYRLPSILLHRSGSARQLYARSVSICNSPSMRTRPFLISEHRSPILARTFASKGAHGEKSIKAEEGKEVSADLYGIQSVSHEHHDGANHDDAHHDPRGHLNKDGTSHFGYSSEHFHWYDPLGGTPPQLTTTVNGVKMIKGVETRPLDELYTVTQENLPFWPRTRMNFWGNHDLGLKIEFLFFWIPTFIIATLAIPCLTMIYMNEEAITAAMTIKVIGRQWYWIYEIETPPKLEEEYNTEVTECLSMPVPTAIVETLVE